jgi:hypothetical protein
MTSSALETFFGSMTLLHQVGASVTDGNPADALEKDGLDDMALVRKIHERLFVHYQPVEVEPMKRADKMVESRYAFVELVPESATARETAWKGQLGHAKRVLKNTKKKTTKKTKTKGVPFLFICHRVMSLMGRLVIGWLQGEGDVFEVI